MVAEAPIATFYKVALNKQGKRVSKVVRQESNDLVKTRSVGSNPISVHQIDEVDVKYCCSRSYKNCYPSNW